MNDMDQQKVSVLILLDLSSAFDTVNLEVLTNIFTKRLNIGGDVLNWFQTYLSDRSQRVRVNNAISTSQTLIA